MSKITLYNNNCFDVFKYLIKENIKFDCIIADLPQEITKNKWDRIIPLEKMWSYLYQLKKNKSTPIILFSNQPFTTKLISSNIEDFKYCRYWEKDRPSNFLNSSKQPLRNIEDIAIFGEDRRTFIEDIIFFYEKQPKYFPQKLIGKENHNMGNQYINKEIQNNNYGKFIPKINDYGHFKFPRQIMEYKRPHPPIHPTEKPVKLLEELIKTYTLEGDLVLDFCMGSGSTGLACKILNRSFIGIEKEKEYFNLALERINNLKNNNEEQLSLFGGI